MVRFLTAKDKEQTTEPESFNGSITVVITKHGYQMTQTILHHPLPNVIDSEHIVKSEHNKQ